MSHVQHQKITLLYAFHIYRSPMFIGWDCLTFFLVRIVSRNVLDVALLHNFHRGFISNVIPVTACFFGEGTSTFYRRANALVVLHPTVRVIFIACESEISHLDPCWRCRDRSLLRTRCSLRSAATRPALTHNIVNEAVLKERTVVCTEGWSDVASERFLVHIGKRTALDGVGDQDVFLATHRELLACGYRWLRLRNVLHERLSRLRSRVSSFAKDSHWRRTCQ